MKMEGSTGSTRENSQPKGRVRKSRAMRVASGVMVLTLLSTCVVAGTYAKYATSVDCSDSARVARWGFTGDSEFNLSELFSNAYKEGPADYDSADVSVKSSDEKVDVIAPGTKGIDRFGFAYDGAPGTAPEVDYEFTLDIDDSSMSQSLFESDRIIWRVDGSEWMSWDEMIDAIKMLSGDASGTKRYSAGELPAAFNAGQTHSIEWRWPFDQDDGGTSVDTALGNTGNLEVALKLMVSAKQVI